MGYFDRNNNHTIALTTPIINGGRINAEQHTITLSSSENSLTSESPNIDSDYNMLANKPQINDVILEGNKSLEELGLYVDTYWTTDNLEEISADDIDVITQSSSSEEVFRRIYLVHDDTMFVDDIELTEQLVVEKDYTIYLNDYELSSMLDTPLFVVDGCTLAIYGPGRITTVGEIYEVINGGHVIFGENNSIMSPSSL